MTGKGKFKLIIVVGILFFAAMVLLGKAPLAPSFAQLNRVVQTVMRPGEPKIDVVGDTFVLPAEASKLPLYDTYTIAQRKQKGLPLEPAIARTYDYEDKTVYLTFDDGPNKQNTEKILDVLKDQGIRGTFFLVGKNVLQCPDVVKRMYTEGNAIGNHTYDHEYKKVYQSPEAYTAELEKTDDAIHNILGVRPIISRAPGGTSGHFTKAFWNRVTSLGYIEVGWNALAGDADGTAPTAPKMVSAIKSQLAKRPYLNNHLVILMHDASGHGETVKALPDIIALLKAEGYHFAVVNASIPPMW